MKVDRVKAAVKRMEALEAQLPPVDRRGVHYREFVDPHPWVLPEVVAAVAATFAIEEHEWELDQLDAIRVRAAGRNPTDFPFPLCPLVCHLKPGPASAQCPLLWGFVHALPLPTFCLVPFAPVPVMT